MSLKIVQQRLASYHCESQQEEFHALKEITQELVLHALYNSGFFKRAAFVGGTCLRILFGLQRFSEDLDFSLYQPDCSFSLAPHLSAVSEQLRAFGYRLSIRDRSEDQSALRTAWLKEDSIWHALELDYPQTGGRRGALKVRLELDINPPAGAGTQTLFHDFPLHFAVISHDLSSLFAGKSHALLCRDYVKGRDWFDFLWFVGSGVQPNLMLLSSALDQLGPWKGDGLVVDRDWYTRQMAERIESIDWLAARKDVQRFLRPRDVKSLELWNSEFFLEILQRLYV